MTLPVLLPALFWAGYHYYKDRHQPEPLVNLALCFLFGIGSYWLGGFMYQALGLVGLRFDAYELAETSRWKLLFYAVFAIGGIEETAKLLPFLLIVTRFRAFEEQLDGIIYASFIALGFAAMENLHYLQFLDRQEAVYRGFAGPLVHIVFASIWGYRIAIRKIRGGKLLGVAFVSVTAAALLHGLYDFVVIALPATALPLAAGLIVAIWIWRLFAIRRIGRSAVHTE